MNVIRNFFGIPPKHKKWYHQYYIRQKTVSENSLACVTILLNYFGRITHLQHLAQRFPLYIKDNNLQALHELCAKNHLHSELFTCSANELGSKKLPCLLYWKSKRFVVLIAMEDEGFCILDPGNPRVGYSFDDFECYYCEEGLAITS